MAQPAIDQFVGNIGHINGLIGLAKAVDELTAGALDVSELYRSAVAMAVSALDHYVHELVLRGTLEVYLGARSVTAAFEKYTIRLSAALIGISAPLPATWLEAELRELNSFKTFQRPEAIADGVRCFSSVSLWPAVAAKLGEDTTAVKKKLDLLVDRRNKIVHEFDSQPTGIGERWPISHAIAVDAVTFIEQLVSAIDNVV